MTHIQTHYICCCSLFNVASDSLGEFSSVLRRHWSCPHCNDTLIVTTLEKIQHETECLQASTGQYTVFRDVISPFLTGNPGDGGDGFKKKRGKQKSGKQHFSITNIKIYILVLSIYTDVC